MHELTRIREELGWSQQKLADESSVNKATINQIERGRRSPNVETLAKLADAMGREIGDFFPKAEPPLPFNQVEEGRGRRPPETVVQLEALELRAELAPIRALARHVRRGAERLEEQAVRGTAEEARLVEERLRKAAEVLDQGLAS